MKERVYSGLWPDYHLLASIPTVVTNHSDGLMLGYFLTLCSLLPLVGTLSAAPCYKHPYIYVSDRVTVIEYILLFPDIH